MSNYIKVSVPKMKSDGDQLYTDTEKIPQFVRELNGAMKMLGTCWEGPAWIAFQQQLESDILNMLEVYDWVRKFLQELSEAEQIYGTCEEKSYDYIEKLRI